MGFESSQIRSKLENVSKFTNYIKFILEEARFVTQKFQKDIVKYYNQRHTSTLVFYSGNKVFLDFANIHTIYPYTKLSYWYLKSYIVKKQVGLILYCLKLSPTLQRLHLVFPVIKLVTVLTNSIPKRYSSSSLDPAIINKEEK